MTFPFHIAIIGAVAVFSLYFLFRDQTNTRRQLTYGSGGSGYSEDSYSSSVQDNYDTNTHRRNSTSVKKNCIICFNEMEEQATIARGNHNRMLQCGHVFHAVCISRWLRESNKCPMCRHNV